MKNFALRAPLVWSVVLVLAACGWSQAQPTLVLELSHVTRGKLTDEAYARSRALAFTAAVSMALERAEAGPLEEGVVPYPREQFTSADAQQRWASEAADPPRDASRGGARELCGAVALCAWAQAAEEAAFGTAVDHLELVP